MHAYKANVKAVVRAWESVESAVPGLSEYHREHVEEAYALALEAALHGKQNTVRHFVKMCSQFMVHGP